MSIATINPNMPKRMIKTTCFRNDEKLDQLLKKISAETSVPVSHLIRHCLLIETPKLAKKYGVEIDEN